ncbi:MAG TPA: hypothetical protein VFF06_25355 [Polyangia bacterium]|nr:hypothetical protein [Polyangia bacterium]
MRLRSITGLALPLLVASMLGACNGNSGVSVGQDAGDQPDLSPVSAPDLGDNGMVSNVYPAPHPDPPQVNDALGPVLKNPVIVPVFFSNDDATQKASLEDFVSKVGATAYWTAATKEYGVNAATATAPVELTETATGTLDDSAIQTWLAGKLNANDPAFPAATSGTVYALHYPAGVTITLQGGFMGGTQQSCSSFGGYHSNTSLDANHGSVRVAYAVIPRCPGVRGLTMLETTTGAESHELVEAATDPFPQSVPAYGQVDDNHLYWMFALGGGEVGDLCAQDPGAFTKFPELPYVVQRTWSNAAAAAGHDPCVPAPAGQVYFNAVPELNDTITIGGMFTMLGVQIPVGQTKTIDLDLFSDGDTGGPWTVKAEDYAQLTGMGASSFTFALDRTTGQNGEKLHLTITTNKASAYNAGIFVVSSKLGTKTHYWFGLVGE